MGPTQSRGGVCGADWRKTLTGSGLQQPGNPLCSYSRRCSTYPSTLPRLESKARKCLSHRVCKRWDTPYKIVPHFDAQELRQYLHQVMATFRKTGKEVVMVVDRSGIHRAHKLDATLDHDHDKFRFHFLPAHCGHHRNPIEGFWRVMKDTIGAGRCFGDLQQLYQRTRRVLMAHQERPIDAFRW